MQLYPNGGYTQNHYPLQDNDDDGYYYYNDDYQYNSSTFPLPRQNMQTKPRQWIPLQKTYYTNMDGYAGYDHTENFKHGRQDYAARYPQFWGGEEQQYYTSNGGKGNYNSGKHHQYPGRVYLDVERSSGYGPRVPVDEQRRYCSKQNKAIPVWVTRGISD